MKTVRKYIADDGMEFDNASDARKHDASKYVDVLAVANKEEIEAAISGKNKATADAIKTAYQAIQQGRKERGEVKPRKKAETETVVSMAEGKRKQKARDIAA